MSGLNLLEQAVEAVLNLFWEDFLQRCPLAAQLFAGQAPPLLDHLAILDLPGPETGISVLNQLFAALGYLPRGREYLPEKQNEFMWLAAYGADRQTVDKAAPQLVLADFRLTDLPPKLQKIVKRTTENLAPFPWQEFHRACGDLQRGEAAALPTVVGLISHYCLTRPWLPLSLKEYLAVKEANELLAWVLVWGRCVNHMGLAVYPQPAQESFADYVADLERAGIQLNHRGGLIKGGPLQGIAQASSAEGLSRQMLADHALEITTPFIEWVWRYSAKSRPGVWGDYFTGFIAGQGDRVVESVYTVQE